MLQNASHSPRTRTAEAMRNKAFCVKMSRRKLIYPHWTSSLAINSENISHAN